MLIIISLERVIDATWFSPECCRTYSSRSLEVWLTESPQLSLEIVLAKDTSLPEGMPLPWTCSDWSLWGTMAWTPSPYLGRQLENSSWVIRILWDFVAAGLLPLYNPDFSLPFYWHSSQRQTLINFLHSNVYLRVYFLGNPVLGRI